MKENFILFSPWLLKSPGDASVSSLFSLVTSKPSMTWVLPPLSNSWIIFIIKIY